MRQHNITERGERHRISPTETVKDAFLSPPSSTPGKAETNQENWEGNTSVQVSTCLLQLCVPCKALNLLPTALSPSNFTNFFFFKEDQQKTIVFEQLTLKYFLSFLLHWLLSFDMCPLNKKYFRESSRIKESLFLNTAIPKWLWYNRPDMQSILGKCQTTTCSILKFCSLLHILSNTTYLSSKKIIKIHSSFLVLQKSP